MDYRAIIVNNNPETVSTDFDIGDGLYFEPVTIEDVLDVVNREKPIGVVCQFGGQTAINLADGLSKAGVKVLGTSPSAIVDAEDRGKFDALLSKLEIKRPAGVAVTNYQDAVQASQKIGFPVLVRPSFVLGGRAMEIVYGPDQLEQFYREAELANPGQPVLIDHYLDGIEAELDVISDGVETFVPGIMEHIERAGVHSGDSMAVYPPVTLDPTIQAQLVSIACRIAKELGVHGLMNVQFVVKDGTPFVIEVNPRASRTVPYLSKVTGIPMVDIATRTMMGQSLTSMGYASGTWVLTNGAWKSPENSFEPRSSGRIVPESATKIDGNEVAFYAVKAPVFSFLKLAKVEPSLGPEMKSTGEVLGVDSTYEAALYKAITASGIQFKGGGTVLMTVRDQDKPQLVEIAQTIVESGRTITATQGTAEFLKKHGVECVVVDKIRDGHPNILDLVMSGEVSMLINSPSPDQFSEAEAALIRRSCIETGVACVTSIDTAKALVRALPYFTDPDMAQCKCLEEYFCASPV